MSKSPTSNPPSSIVILVLGQTGAGKSYFINKLLAEAGSKHHVQVGEQQSSCTSDITPVTASGLTSKHPTSKGCPLVVVDTPGFDNTLVSDRDICDRVEVWLTESCRDGTVLGGIIYIYDISQDRPSAPARVNSNLQMLREVLRQPELMGKVVLVTSKWDRVMCGDLETKEKDLSSKHWAFVVKAGARIVRFEAKKEGASARSIVDSLLELLEQPADTMPHQSVVKRLKRAHSVFIAGSSRNTDSSQEAGRTMPTPKSSRLIIPVMGATKAGKSSFINMVLKEVGSVDRLLIGNELASCTVNLRDVEVKVLRSDNAALEGRRVTLVDTPGFDGTHASDFEILKQIAEWLEKSCKQGDVLGGVLYLHDISRDQISGTARRTFELFNHLCGDACLNKAVLVTTKWGRANGRDFVAREAELKGKYWLTMIEKGASTMRLDDEDEGASALRIVDEMLRRLERPDGQAFLREVLQIQDEMVRQKKSFPQTEAAKAVRAWYEGMIEAQAEMLKYQAMAAKGDAEAAAKVRAEEEKLDKLARDVKKLRLSVGQRFLENTQRLFRS